MTPGLLGWKASEMEGGIYTVVPYGVAVHIRRARQCWLCCAHECLFEISPPAWH